jgi:hypothetical protein
MIHKASGSKDVPIIFQCPSGVGRSASLMTLYAIYMAAKAEKAAGRSCCYNAKQQKLQRVNGNLNLAYVVRNFLLIALSKRSVFGNKIEECKMYEKYAQFCANNSQVK